MIKDILTPEMLAKGKFWTDAWSLVEGCKPVSPGCAHCWLAGIENRFRPDSICLTDGRFNGMVIQHPERLQIPSSKRKPRVFAIWSDLFHENVSWEFQYKAFERMGFCHQHYYLVITKRPENAVKAMSNIKLHLQRNHGDIDLSNVLILVTMENQDAAWKRTTHAAQLAAMGWTIGALVEPMLGPVVFDRFIPSETGHKLLFKWVICGPENGPGKRTFDPLWAIDLRNAAQRAGIPFLFKGRVEINEINKFGFSPTEMSREHPVLFGGITV